LNFVVNIKIYSILTLFALGISIISAVSTAAGLRVDWAY